jgi:uncharacterized protein YqhQ
MGMREQRQSIEGSLKDKFNYGGQAVIEGVVMRGRRSISIAVRRPNGEICLTSRALPAILTGWIREKPFTRGIAALIEAFAIGIRAIFYSANVALEEEDVEIKGKAVWATFATMLILATAFFIVVPLMIARALDPYITSSLVSNIIEGLIRLSLVILYLFIINRWQHIRSVFSYHGAEHKAINAFEAGVPLEVENVRMFPTAHTRCGTGFLLTVLVLAIFAFAILGRPSIWLSVVYRIAITPAIAAVAYELMRFSAAHYRNRLVRVMIYPGLLLQRLTTNEPDDAQLEVSITALTNAVDMDKATESARPGD